MSDAFKPVFKAKLTEFWKLLREITKKDGLLHFSARPEFFPKRMKSLYVRKAYEDLFRIIRENHQYEDPEKQFCRMAITGTPGTGKSVFLFYILWRLANMETTKTVILHRQIERGCIYVFQNSGCWETFNYSDIAHLLHDTTTWYLTDALEPPPALVNAVTILVSSPAQKYYSNFLTYLPIPPLHYLPVCSLEELKLMAPLYGKDEETVKKRYNMMGGVARHVLEENEDLEATINKAIKIQLSKKPMAILSIEGFRENEINHQVVHFEVNPPCYTKYKMVMASEYVRGKFFEELRDQPEQELKYYLFLLEDLPFAIFAVERLFEHYANQRLSAGGTFSMRSLDEGFRRNIDFLPKKPQRFEEFSECTSLSVYYMPETKKFPFISSLMARMGYFRMTMSLRHEITWEQMEELKKAMDIRKLYFVVPHTHFEKFKNQSFTGDTKKKEKISASSVIDQMSNLRVSEKVNETNKENAAQLMNVNNEKDSKKDFIRQFVISLPIDREMTGLFDRIEQLKRAVQQDEEVG